MRAERCQCGKMVRYGSGMTYHPCEGCAECKTTYAGHPDYHQELQPHEWRPIYDRYSGEKSDEECSRCLTKRSREEAA